MNTFINFVKKFLKGGGTKDGVGVSRGIQVLLLPALDLLAGLWTLASSSYSVELTERFTQGLCRVVQDLSAIARNKNLNIIFLNGLADVLDIELLKL